MKPMIRHVLLVEDSEELADNLAEILRAADFETKVVHSAEQALGVLSSQAFDSIVSDLRLPKKTGVELLACLREQGLKTPVILMSAFADEQARATAHRLGAVALLDKPFNCARLVALLDGACSPSP